MLLTTSLSLFSSVKECEGRGEVVQLEVGGLDAACNRGDCIASVSLSLGLSRVSRKLNCLGNCKVILSALATGAQRGA